MFGATENKPNGGAIIDERRGCSKSWNTRWNAHATSGVMTGFVPVPDSGTPLGTPEATTHHTLCVCVGTVSAERVEEQKSDSDALLVFQTPRTGLGTRNAHATSGVMTGFVPVPESGTPLGTPEATTHHTLRVCVSVR